MRYLIFGGQRYYAQGGGYDLRMEAGALSTAKGLAEELIGKPMDEGDGWDWGDYEWSHVLATKLHTVVATFGAPPYGAP